jgi:HK97 family phage major capsid protein
MSQEFDELLSRRVKMLEEARVLVLDPKAGAEEFLKAVKIREDAALLGKRASSLKEIEMEQDLLAHDLTSKGGLQTANGFKDIQDYIQSLKFFLNSKGTRIDPRFEMYDESGPNLKAINVKDMSGSSGAAGGFLIPIAQLTTIMGVAAPLAVVRRYATIIRTTQRQIKIPVVDQTGSTAGQANFFGGMVVFFQEEASAASQSDAKFRQAELSVRELIGYTVFSNSLLADADPSLADFLTGPLGFPGAIAWKEDYAFIRGSGAGEPLGIVNAPATKAVTRTTASTIKYDDLVNMEAGFLGSNPIWIATQGAKATLMLMNGPSGNPLYLWGSARDGVPDTLLGHPIFFTDKQPAVGTIGDIVLADLRYYIVLDRQAISVDTSDQEKFQKNQTSLRVIERIEGAPWLSAPITLQDGTTTMSPFVQIAT